MKPTTPTQAGDALVFIGALAISTATLAALLVPMISGVLR